MKAVWKPPSGHFARETATDTKRASRLSGKIKARQATKAARAGAEKRSRFFTTLGLAGGLVSWGYSQLAPSPSIVVFNTLIAIAGVLFAIGIWEFFNSLSLRIIITVAIVLSAAWSIKWAHVQISNTNSPIQQHDSESKRVNVVPPPQIYQQTPNMRVTYLRFEGPLLLEQVLAGNGFDQQDGFLSKPFVVENQVYHNLTSLLSTLKGIRTASRSFDNLSIYAEADAGKEGWFVEAHNGKVSQLGSGTNADSARVTIERAYPQAFTRRGPNFIGPLNADSLFSRVDSDPYWQIDVLSDRDLIPFDGYAFVGLPDVKEAVSYLHDKISLEILRVNPRLRDVVVMTAHSIHGGYYGTFWLREIKLVCLDVENVGDKPIGLASFNQQSTSVSDVFAANTTAIAEGGLKDAAVTEYPFKPGILRPNEHVLVPLRVEFGLGDKIKDHPTHNGEGLLEEDIFPKKWWERREQENIPFEVLVSSDDRGNPNTHVRTVSRSILGRKPDLSTTIQKTYVLGSSINVKKILLKTGDGTPTIWNVRRFDPRNLISRGDYEVGSCPILYVKRQDNRWDRLGPVLMNAVTRAREGEFIIPVQPQAELFMLSEEEDETTFLKEVKLVISLANGEQYVAPLKSTLIPTSREYRTLSPTQSLQFDFIVPDSLKGRGSWTLVVTGYYVPHSLLVR